MYRWMLRRALPKPDRARATVRAQQVDATPSDTNRLLKGGVHDAREAGEAFRDAEDRAVGPLERRAVVASN